MLRALHWRPAIGSWSIQVANCAHSCSILLYRGFCEFYRSSTVCRTLVAASISVQIRQAPSTFHPEHQEYVCWSHGTAGLAVLRVVTELYMIVRDLFQLSWMISWLTTARHPSSLPVYVRVTPLLTLSGQLSHICDRAKWSKFICKSHIMY